jgi:hypothetical protein
MMNPSFGYAAGFTVPSLEERTRDIVESTERMTHMVR